VNNTTSPDSRGYTILLNDSNIIAVNKCSGIAVIPARGEEPSLSLKNTIEQDIQAPLFTVHRIDKGTSGVVLFAKNAAIHKLLNRQFEHRRVKKKYIALVLGVMENGCRYTACLKEFGSGRMGVHPKGKPSETQVEIVTALRGATLVRAYPSTGRRHQIRVHLYHGGFPICGDTLYGHDRPVGGVHRLMLHAEELTVEYPEGKMCTIHAGVDAEWESIVTAWDGAHLPKPGITTIDMDCE